MKSFIISAAVLALVLIFCVSMAAWAQSYCDRLLNIVNEFPESADSDAGNEEYCKRLKSAWDEGQALIRLCVNKSVTDQCEKEILNLTQSLLNGNQWEYPKAKEDLTHSLKHLQMMAGFSTDAFF